ncbi:hypothetical protein [Klebsiella michiganensis]
MIKIMWDDRVINFFCLLIVVLASVMFLFKLTQPSNDDLIKDGKYWSTDCTLKEVDIPTGFLTSNINRLDCSGVVVNVVTDKYDRAVTAYNKSK